jgi:hypothetical protein
MVAGADDAWTLGRQEISDILGRAETTDVVLGFGVQLPTGVEQRAAFRLQLEWLECHMAPKTFRVWAFGGRPTHPSRWQRVSHSHSPGASLSSVATRLLTPFSLRDWRVE